MFIETFVIVNLQVDCIKCFWLKRIVLLLGNYFIV